ncbi:MAG: hypothetical protein QW041_02515 [Candidatus Pacearchaeota archaeon]
MKNIVKLSKASIQKLRELEEWHKKAEKETTKRVKEKIEKKHGRLDGLNILVIGQKYVCSSKPYKSAFSSLGAIVNINDSGSFDGIEKYEPKQVLVVDYNPEVKGLLTSAKKYSKEIEKFLFKVLTYSKFGCGVLSEEEECPFELRKMFDKVCSGVHTYDNPLVYCIDDVLKLKDYLI